MLECKLIMPRRRTKKEKLKTAERKQGFAVNFDSIGGSEKTKAGRVEAEKENFAYLRGDLTKVLAISMLAVGSELALWWFLFK